jgi:hypothetical protein
VWSTIVNCNQWKLFVAMPINGLHCSVVLVHCRKLLWLCSWCALLGGAGALLEAIVATLTASSCRLAF